MRQRRLGLFALILPLLVTCRAPVATHPSKPSPRELIASSVALMDGTTVVLRFDPPPIYFMWRAQMERCSGLTRDGTPTFWIAAAITLNAQGAIGMFVRDERRIVLALGAETLSWVVRHEILHDLLNIEKGNPHPPEFLVDRCGALVQPSPAGGL